MSCIRFAKGVWIVRCMVHYKYVMIGYYSTKELAIIAYNDYVLKNNLNRKIKISS
jgi:hypothetical protein